MIVRIYQATKDTATLEEKLIDSHQLNLLDVEDETVIDLEHSQIEPTIIRSVDDFESSTTAAEEAGTPDDDDMIGQHRDIYQDEEEESEYDADSVLIENQ